MDKPVFSRQETAFLLGVGVRQLDYLAKLFDIQPISLGRYRSNVIYDADLIIELKVANHLKNQDLPIEFIKGFLLAIKIGGYHGNFYSITISELRKLSPNKNFLDIPSYRIYYDENNRIQYMLLTAEDFKKFTCEILLNMEKCEFKSFKLPTKDKMFEELELKAKETGIEPERIKKLLAA